MLRKYDGRYQDKPGAGLGTEASNGPETTVLRLNIKRKWLLSRKSKKLFGAVMDLKAPGAEGFEVKEVIWRCDGSKELSPEGFTLAFYRKAWIILGNELLQLVNGFLRTGKLAKGIQAPHDALVSHNTDRLAKSMAITK
ncbi:hypothetical protein OIU84_010545 [Salix udensis]|uniref:Uncharacterized protein n=1 Tax=Salix udensis TaxID=889485 RepID=A0AAD6NVZ4_9ROSI|nr:hypothetical protein OIU84_010545 [Salix udensis]